MIEEHPRMAWIYASTKVDTHQQQLGIVEGGAVSDGGVSAAWMPRPSPHGWVYGVPAIRHRPAKPTDSAEPAVAVASAVAVAVEVAGQRPALPQVPGAARPDPLQHLVRALGRIEHIARRELLAQVMQCLPVLLQ